MAEQTKCRHGIDAAFCIACDMPCRRGAAVPAQSAPTPEPKKLYGPCEYCGPTCYRGAEHNARVEDNARFDDVPAQSAPTPEWGPIGRPVENKCHDCGGEIIHGIPHRFCPPIPPTSAPGNDGGHISHETAQQMLDALAAKTREIASLRSQLADAERKGWNDCAKRLSLSVEGVEPESWDYDETKKFDAAFEDAKGESK